MESLFFFVLLIQINVFLSCLFDNRYWQYYQKAMSHERRIFTMITLTENGKKQLARFTSGHDDPIMRIRLGFG